MHGVDCFILGKLFGEPSRASPLTPPSMFNARNLLLRGTWGCEGSRWGRWGAGYKLSAWGKPWQNLWSQKLSADRVDSKRRDRTPVPHHTNSHSHHLSTLHAPHAWQALHAATLPGPFSRQRTGAQREQAGVTWLFHCPRPSLAKHDPNPPATRGQVLWQLQGSHP